MNMDQAQSQARSFADVGYDEAIRRAAGLIPFLREHAGAAESERSMPPAVAAELHRTGLIRYLQPKSWGGMELDFVATVDIPDMLARGDCSTAWNVANLATHHRTLALFNEQVQKEVWGENPDALIAAGIAYPQGRARRVDGGLRLSGTWNFCSAVDGSGWNMLACTVRDGNNPVDWCYCLLRRPEYEIVDDWQTLGMRGTGSCTVKVEELFVPGPRIPRSESQSQPHVPRPDLRARRARPCRVYHRRGAGRARRDDRMGEEPQHQLYECEDVRFSDRAAADRHCRRQSPCGAPHAA
jgi:3-hydroxy-9,10-secoandrosta-1,3,5(10)-triene-9,17-dione monooxygenase